MPGHAACRLSRSIPRIIDRFEPTMSLTGRETDKTDTIARGNQGIASVTWRAYRPCPCGRGRRPTAGVAANMVGGTVPLHHRRRPKPGRWELSRSGGEKRDGEGKTRRRAPLPPAVASLLLPVLPPPQSRPAARPRPQIRGWLRRPPRPGGARSLPSRPIPGSPRPIAAIPCAKTSGSAEC